MSHIWTNEHEPTLMDAFSSYAEHENEYAQINEDGTVGTSRPWDALLYPSDVVSEPLPTTMDVNAQIHAHVPNGPSDLLWGLPEYSFGISRLPGFQLNGLSSSAHPYSHFLEEPYFEQGYGQEIQGTPTPANWGSVAPNDQLVEASKGIIKIMTSFKVLPNQDMAKHDVKISQAEQTLNDYVFSLPQDVYLCIEGKRRSRVGAPSARNHSTTRRTHVGKKGLYLCLWCHETITTKSNFANHIRAHLNIHLSFCGHCDFSSVTPKLPSRHRCGKVNGKD